MQYKGFVPSHKLPLRPGDRVVIPKGIPFKSTHPQKGSGVTGRTYTVEINHLLNGYRVESGRDLNPEVRWAGAGCYWKWVDINDIRDANLSLFEAREKELES